MQVAKFSFLCCVLLTVYIVEAASLDLVDGVTANATTETSQLAMNVTETITISNSSSTTTTTGNPVNTTTGLANTTTTTTTTAPTANTTSPATTNTSITTTSLPDNSTTKLVITNSTTAPSFNTTTVHGNTTSPAVTTPNAIIEYINQFNVASFFVGFFVAAALILIAWFTVGCIKKRRARRYEQF